MSTFGSALKAIQDVLELRFKVERLEQGLKIVEHDLNDMVRYTHELSNRLAKLEGIVEGMGMAVAAGRVRPLPRLK